MKYFRVLFFVIFAVFALTRHALPLDAQPPSPLDFSRHIFLPLLTGSGCENPPGETYATLVPNPPPTDRPAEQHADLNLALRGSKLTTGTLGLVDYGGKTDGRGPKLFSLFGDNRVPTFTSVSQVYDWIWETNRRGDLINDPEVTLAGMRVGANEILRVPHSEYNIGTAKVRPSHGFFADAPADDPNNFEVLVLYASEERVTLKYTREDNVVRGYTLHVENICAAPDLLNLYRTWNGLGRTQLPALKQGQGFGRARGSEIGVVIRDNGSFMDPRAKKDWW